MSALEAIVYLLPLISTQTLLQSFAPVLPNQTSSGCRPAVTQQDSTHALLEMEVLAIVFASPIPSIMQYNADWGLIPFSHCPVHSTSWQAGCAVCDRALPFLSKATADDPNSLAASVRSLRRESTKPTYTAELGLVGQEVARHVSHQSEPLTTGQASQLSLANLMVSPAQELKIGYDLQVEAFLQDFEKRRTFQQQLVYKGKLIGLLEGIRESMTPLFSHTNELGGFEAKLKTLLWGVGHHSRTAGQKTQVSGRVSARIHILSS